MANSQMDLAKQYLESKNPGITEKMEKAASYGSGVGMSESQWVELAKGEGWTGSAGGSDEVSAKLSQQLQSYRDYVATQREQVSKLQSYLSDPANLEAERKLAVAQATRQLGSEYASRGLSKSGHMSSALERVVYESQAKASSDLLNRQLQASQLGYQMNMIEQSLASAEIGNTQWVANYQNALASLDLQKQQLALQKEQSEGGLFDTLKGIVGLGSAGVSMYSGINQGSYYGAAASNLKSGYTGGYANV